MNSASSLNSEEMQMSHFMLIDGNAESRVQLSNVLRKEGITVSEAETISQAIEFSRRTGIDAIVIQTTSVESEGCKALDAVRREGIVAPVVLLAERCDDRSRERCQAKGAQVLKQGSTPKTMVAACVSTMAV
jgi:CheY-like chemotaxis protein